MLYQLINNLVISSDTYRIISFNKDTVALSYVIEYENPSKKEVKMAIVGVDKITKEVIHTFVSSTYINEEYDFIKSLFNSDWTLTDAGYVYALNNFYINQQLLSTIISGPISE